jgi:hypothetical protein
MSSRDIVLCKYVHQQFKLIGIHDEENTTHLNATEHLQPLHLRGKLNDEQKLLVANNSFSTGSVQREVVHTTRMKSHHLDEAESCSLQT